MSFLASWKQRVRELRVEIHALYLACRDPRVPWYAKAFAACVVGYALSPIDLIPDFIPVLGYLDDLVLVPLGIVLARRMIPKEVLAECRERARAAVAEGVPVNRTAAAIIIGIWVLGAAATGWLVMRYLARRNAV